MVTFTNEKISPRITRIRDGSDVCMYLVEGTNRAVLIDTGYGIGELKAYVDTLTDKPYEVYLTHGHVDHASGAAQFPVVHMNQEDSALFLKHTTVEFRRQKLAAHTRLQLEDVDFQPQRTEPILPLVDGEVVELGGASLRWLHIPGHTAGTMVALLPEERTIFFGDACGVGNLLALPESLPVASYYKSLKKLQTFEPLYDTVLRQHGACRSTPRVLEDNIENCERIMAGTDDKVPAECAGIPCLRACKVDPTTGARLDGREGNILYDKDRIYE